MCASNADRRFPYPVVRRRPGSTARTSLAGDAACNIDSREFIGAVSRIICEPHIVVPPPRDDGCIKLIALLPGEQRDNAALDRFADRARGLPLLAGLVLYCVLEQGPAPNSTIPHLPV